MDDNSILSNLHIPVFDIESFRNYALKLKLSGKINFNISESSVLLESKDTLVFISHDEFIQLSLMGYGSRQYLILNTSISRLKVLIKDREDALNNVYIKYVSSKEYLVFTSSKSISLSYYSLYWDSDFIDLNFSKWYKCYVLNDKVVLEDSHYVDFVLSKFGRSHRYAHATVGKSGIVSVDFTEAELITNGVLCNE